MTHAFKIDMIGAGQSRFPLGAVRSQSIKQNASGDEGPGMVVMGELLLTPGAEWHRLSHRSVTKAPMTLEISDDHKIYRGKFKLASFDPNSHEAVFWSAGDILSTPA